MRYLSSVVALLLTTTGVVAIPPPQTVLNSGEHGLLQMEWVKAHGGFVHEAFEIRRVDPEDNESRFGVFAKTDLKQDEVILIVPRALLIDSGDDEEGDPCATVVNLAREMQLGENSKYEPYVSYLNSQAYGQLPTMWTEAGKEALGELLGWNDEFEDHVLPPSGALTTGHGCATTNDFEKNAEMLVRQRSWDNILIPVWDMVSHRNGRWLNVEEKYSVHDTDYPVTAIANRDIAAGEELYMSYSLCPDCSNRYSGYGTAEILRDYGFVENYPQKWVFEDQQFEFTLDYEYDEHNNIVSLEEDGLIFTWEEESELPHVEDLEFFEQEVERVRSFDWDATKPDDIPQHEWDVIVDYRKSITVAMERLVWEIQQEEGIDNEEEVEWEEYEEEEF